MNRLLLSLLLAGALPGYSQHQKPVPPWSHIENVADIPSIDAQKAKDGYYYVYAGEQYNAAERHNFFHYAMRAVTEAGLGSVSRLEVSFDPEYQSAFFHFIRIHRNGQVIDRTNDAAITVLNSEAERNAGIHSGRKTLYCDLGDTRSGDIVEYSYSVKGYNRNYGRFFSADLYLGYTVPVGRIRCSVITAPGDKLSIVNRGNVPEPVLSREKNTCYTWSVDRPEIVKVPENAPDWYVANPRVLVSNTADWSEVKKLFRGIYRGADLHSPLLEQLCSRIAAEHPGDTESRITAAVAFVQDEVRYSGYENGVHSHVPHDAEYVLRNRYGDCKDKSMLLVNLLGGLGVKSCPALVNTSLCHRTSDDPPSVDRFDHCIVAIDYDNSLWFIDPTSGFQKGSFRERYTGDYRLAMVLDDDERPFREVRRPRHEVDISEVFHVVSGTADATLTATFTYKGLAADETRAYFASNSRDDIQESYRKVYGVFGDEVEVLDSVTAEEGNSANSFVTKERYLVKGFWIREKEKNRKTTTIDLYPVYLNQRVKYSDEKTRQAPFRLNYPSKVHQEMRLVKQDGWGISNAGVNEKNEFFDYSYNTINTGPELVLDYHYASLQAEVPAAEFPAYRKTSDFVSENMIMNIVHSIGDQGSGFNWLLFGAFAASLAVSVIICVKLYRRNFVPAFENRYDSIGGWLVLVGIGIVITPFSLAYQLYGVYGEQFGISYYTVFFDPESLLYDPLKGYFSILMCALNTLLLCFSVVLMAVFFQRRTSFRYYYIAFRALNLALLLLDAGISYALFYDLGSAEDQKLISEQKADIFKVAVQAAIWIPYVWYSDRCRHTFTNGDADAAAPSEEEMTLAVAEAPQSPLNTDPGTTA